MSPSGTVSGPPDPCENAARGGGKTATTPPAGGGPIRAKETGSPGDNSSSQSVKDHPAPSKDDASRAGCQAVRKCEFCASFGASRWLLLGEHAILDRQTIEGERATIVVDASAVCYSVDLCVLCALELLRMRAEGRWPADAILERQAILERKARRVSFTSGRGPDRAEGRPPGQRYAFPGKDESPGELNPRGPRARSVAAEDSSATAPRSLQGPTDSASFSRRPGGPHSGVQGQSPSGLSPIERHRASCPNATVVRSLPRPCSCEPG